MDHSNNNATAGPGTALAAPLPRATNPQHPMLNPAQRKAAQAAEAARYQHRGPRPAQACTVHSIYYDVRDRWVPMLRLRGLWLEEIGLGIGSRVSIQCEAGKLILSLIAAPAKSTKPPKPRPKRQSSWHVGRARRRALMCVEPA